MVAETDETGAIRLTPDPRRRLPGRGAWLHPTGDCLDQALRRRAFGRALRVRAAPDPEAVAAYVKGVDRDHEQDVHQAPPSIAHGNRKRV
ncbi:YlxR family protein [Pedococcus sp. 5OH_020]|uniref:YlxR family protein n=1 Tax=Pedococcus sp. 5OH_020 TaxID=2989814 RepID=UPI003FA790B3